MKRKTVFVGLSGGVDSSVAAYRLKKQGYNVVGVFIKVWQPDFIDCNWEAERLDAMRAAAHLEIPFLTCDAEAAYKQEVADYFIAEYKAGRTPNPDVMCNKAVKFGAFFDFAMAHGADYIATGHYARVKEREGELCLCRGVDQNKDQSYFLWTLKQEQLAKILLPIGISKKEEIRKEAAEIGLPVAQKKDSQGICFLGHIDIPEFLSHYIDLKEGAVLNEAGEKIGVHKGVEVYTLGQRHGLEITENSARREVYYIVDKNIEKNTLTVSTNQPKTNPEEDLKLDQVNILSKNFTSGSQIEFQTRYRQTPIKGRVIAVSSDNQTASLEGDLEQQIITPGQSCVLYQDDVCLGGGIIST